ncbi:hypothetical protein [Streptomyces sp. NPDC001268]|uniref:hypothetical protein n=1 Tax=Streptomyces sp. NPDC001268 TaxID=3364553 RepID=UPI0036948793
MYAVLAVGVVVFALTIWCSIAVARLRDIPKWRRLLPLSLFVVSNCLSLLRAFEITAPAEIAAFPLNLATIVIGLGEIRAHRRREDASRA